MNELKSGNVYIIKAINFTNVKIGYWTGTLNALKQRYTTYYGTGIEVFAYFTEFPRKIEKEFKNHFKKYNISYEIYDIDFIEQYKLFFEDKTKVKVVKVKEVPKKIKEGVIKTIKEEVTDDYICKRCSYKSDQKSHLLRHLYRKKFCVVTNEDIDVDILIDELLIKKEYNEKTYDCNFCDQKFNSASNKCRHQKICKHKEESSTKKINNLTKLVIELKDKLDKNIIIKNKNIDNTSTKTIILNNFSHEAISYIPKKTIRECLNDMNMICLIELIHFNPDYPENYTVRPRNINRNIFEYYQEQKWNLSYKDDILMKMIKNGYHILNTYYENNKIKFDENIKEWLHKINNEDLKIIQELKKNIYLIILNNKDMVFGR